jgi:ABC-type multidrug transport system ATPase subunit
LEINKEFLETIKNLWPENDSLTHKISLSTEHLFYHEPLISNQNLFFDKNQTYLLTGLIGSGKTTLLSLLAGYCFPQSGKIFFHQQNITEYGLWKRNKMGLRYLPEKMPFFETYSMRDHLIFALECNKLSFVSKQYLITLLLHFLEQEHNAHKAIKLLPPEAKRIMELACLFLGSYSFFILDLPFVSLSKYKREKFFYLLEFWLRHTQGTVIFTDPFLSSALEKEHLHCMPVNLLEIY